LLSSTESGLQHALNDFATACDNAGMKISTTKTEVLHLSRNPDQNSLQVNGIPLKQVEKFKQLRVVFTNDGRQDEELDNRTGKASTMIRALQNLVVVRETRIVEKRKALSFPKGPSHSGGKGLSSADILRSRGKGSSKGADVRTF